MTETKEVITKEMDRLYALAQEIAKRPLSPIERLRLLSWAREFKDKITELLIGM